MKGRPRRGSSPGASAEPRPDHLAGLADLPEGRGLLSALIVVVITSVLVSLMPPSALTSRLSDVTSPVTELTGLRQRWELFAPPQTGSTTLRAEVDLRDGETLEWHPPAGGRGLSAYRYYRWRRWTGFTQNPEREFLHRQASHYIWRETSATSTEPIEVRLYRRRAVVPRWGTGISLPDEPDWEETLLYITDAPEPSIVDGQ